MRKFLTLLLLAVLGVGGWLAWALWLPVTPAGQKFVMLRPGYSTRRIAAELQAAGVIKSRLAFILWHRFHRRQSLKAGEYLFDKTARMLEVNDRLVRGDIYVHTVVIPEGFTMFDIAQAIQDAGLGSSQDFLAVAQSDRELISDLAPEAKSLEGYLFPNTYEFTRTQSMKDIAAVMVRQFRQVAAQIGLTTTGANPNSLTMVGLTPNGPTPSGQGMDVQKTVTMASIIEKETAVPEERAVVASVYYNRLAHRIALQADPSVIYAEMLNGNYSGSLHHEDMAFQSAYNTYAHPGLPPGPIGNPGRTSLEAALHPAQTDYYYFVSDGNGHHRFSRSLEEHNQNVAKLRQAMQRK
ncbi:MAG: endolytic transglycosylase MltG [Terriglobales bacterium]